MEGKTGCGQEGSFFVELDFLVGHFSNAICRDGLFIRANALLFGLELLP